MEELGPYRMNPQRIHYEGKHLGRGGNAIVWSGTLDGPNSVVAVKMLNPPTRQSDAVNHVRLTYVSHPPPPFFLARIFYLPNRLWGGKRLAREMNVWKRTNHPNILPLIGFCLTLETLEALIVCPLMKNSNIGAYIRKASPSPRVEERLQWVSMKGHRALNRSD